MHYRKLYFIQTLFFILIVNLLTACGSGGSSDTSKSTSVNATSSKPTLGTEDNTTGVTPPIDYLEEAIKSGLVLQVSTKELLQSARDEIANLKVGNSLLSEIYQNGKITYKTGNYHSQLINITGDANKMYPILYGNKNNVLAVVGEKDKSKFSVFASNPLYFFNKNENLEYEPYMKRVFAWLIGGKPIDTDLKNSSKNIVLSFVSDSNAVKSWMGKNYPKWNFKTCNDSLTLESCYAGADLIVLGRSGGETGAEALTVALKKVLENAKPILYLHDNWGENHLSNVIEETFEVDFPYAGNYWVNDGVSWANMEAMQSAFYENSGYEAINTMLGHFQKNDYSFTWSMCKDKNGYGENKEDCSEVVGLNSEFQIGATKVRSMMTALDSKKKNIFTSDAYRLQKLLALIGDKFRQGVLYPMDKVTTDDNTFMKSFYADHAVYNYRKINPVQSDMGNFSRSDFSHITPITKTVNIMSKKNFRSVGLYALPGETLKVTRTDSSSLTVKVFINTLRSGATHQYQKNTASDKGYVRPKYLQTPHFEIKSGESIELTSPYGGTLQLEFSSNDLPVEVKFENVGEHPYWASSADNDFFAKKMSAHEYDWAEVSTAGFTVHSKHDKMLKSIDNENWGGTAAGLAQAIEKYTSNYPHVLAGFKGKGVDVVPEIHDWADENNLTIETIETMKHMNADQATCGYGCSGNPYDAYWAFNPIGHGDIHELGHSLQKKRFEGFENHAATNTFSYYTKSKYFELTSGNPSCQSLPFKSVFETIQSSVEENNITAFLKTNLWDNAGWQEPYVLKMNAMMHAQKLGKVDNGWHVLARVHILEREMSRAKKNWETKKDSVGFSTYSSDEINAIRDNDWLIVAYSYAAKLDYRNYFDMMGIPYSKKAREQIESFGFEIVPNSLFVSSKSGYCKTDDYGSIFDRPTLPIDGNEAYSY